MNFLQSRLNLRNNAYLRKNGVIIRFHYNKQNEKKGLPWTLHTSRQCVSASHVLFHVPIETEENPKKKSNPKYFLKCNGNIRMSGTIAHVERLK